MSPNNNVSARTFPYYPDPFRTAPLWRAARHATRKPLIVCVACHAWLPGAFLPKDLTGFR
ncbi:hypothetical protein BN2475_310153 [Paraburkholderia ribeironis]|uniref:Uncharacterized protein n=1 Tax=Paraburkholderia ribeironis TaxID=1247936 RepID=A0A1N7S308_9BURK|nr:hypothetical protein BN2475_310153 [Paraburkholderia ribeironis]